jgi:acetylornithine deacetylase/succinyl-diaminopimelate desuccinylase-like protein
MDKTKTLETVDKYWEPWYVTGICDFIKIPNLTPMCDPNYTTNGLFEQAIELVDSYIQKLEIVGIERKIFRPEGMLPLIVYVV